MNLSRASYRIRARRSQKSATATLLDGQTNDAANKTGGRGGKKKAISRPGHGHASPRHGALDWLIALMGPGPEVDC